MTTTSARKETFLQVTSPSATQNVPDTSSLMFQQKTVTTGTKLTTSNSESKIDYNSTFIFDQQNHTNQTTLCNTCTIKKIWFHLKCAILDDLTTNKKYSTIYSNAVSEIETTATLPGKPFHNKTDFLTLTFA